jgi:hypothetical protein
MHTVVETPVYLADAERLCSPDEQKAVVDRLASDPPYAVWLFREAVEFVRCGSASAVVARAAAPA